MCSHHLQSVYVKQPVFCKVCKDYIIGCAYQFQLCTVCGLPFHPVCASIAESVECKPMKSGDSSVSFSSEPKPMNTWSVDDCCLWLAAILAYRYMARFYNKKINGYELEQLGYSEKSNTDLKISDATHLSAIKSAVVNTCEKLPLTVLPMLHQSSNTDHGHRLRSCFAMSGKCGRCHMQNGLMIQGWECVACSIKFHRMCALFDLPYCNFTHIPDFRLENKIFGKPLKEQVDQYDSGVPPFVKICVDRIEQSYNGKDAIYYLSAKATEIQTFRDKIETINLKDILSLRSSKEEKQNFYRYLSNVQLNIICGGLKAYFRELPDPILSMSVYNNLLNLCHYRDGGASLEIERIISSLDHVHQRTFDYFFKHLNNVLAKRAVTVENLGNVFCHIFMRPPHNEVLSIVKNESLHKPVCINIFNNYHPPGDENYVEVFPSVQTHPDPSAISNEELDKVGWYHGQVSPEETQELMDGAPDGSFFVRDSINRPGTFTLVLKYFGENKMIRIESGNGGFNFTPPYKFHSVVHLINHFKINSLFEYNKILNTRLKHPVNRVTLSQDETDSNVEVRELQKHFSKITTKIKKSEEEFEKYSLKRDETIDKINFMSKQQTNLKILISWLEKANAMFPSENNAISEHKSVLKKLDAFKNDCVQEVQRYDQKIEESRADVDANKGRQNEYKKLLKARTSVHEFEKIMDDLKDQPCEDKDFVDSPDQIDVKYMELNKSKHLWYYPTITRQEGERMMKSISDIIDGTFLIRQSAEKDIFAVTFWFCGEVNHCKIFRATDGGLGFAEPYLCHQSLEDFVLHYTKHTLAIHNPKLTTTFTMPLGKYPHH